MASSSTAGIDHAPAVPQCRLCDAMLPRCRERRVLLSDNSKHVVPKAAQLLCDSLPGNTPDDHVKEERTVLLI